MSGKITEVIPGSIAEEMGIEPGDILLSINGHAVNDLIDYNYYSDDDYLELEIQKPKKEVWVYELEKYPEEELGLVFEANVFDGIHSCHNHCVFCFIDQLQPNPRRSLLVKDDDYRMSFLEGNYITCTNLREEDYQRIGEMHLSPLYISIHTVEPILRQKMLGRTQPAEILLALQRLISMGCTLHGQIVLCPGMNDGAYLAQSIDALYALYPGLASLAIVPVGLTRFQKNSDLRLFTKAEAAAIIDDVEARQRRYVTECGSHFVYVADELYIKAGRPFPPVETYEDFCQIENGVGMASLFLHRFEQVKDSIPCHPPEGRIAIATAHNGVSVLKGAVEEINRVSGAEIELLEVKNTFYGESITASGLITGGCLLDAISPGTYDIILLPSNMLKFDEDIFLDDMTAEEVARRLKTELRIVELDPASLLAALFEDGEAWYE